MIRLTTLTLAVLFSVSSAAGQRINPELLKRKGESLQTEFVAGLDRLAEEYEKAGLIEESKETLRRRLEIAEDPEVTAKLEELEERDFDLRRRELKVDAAYGWTDTGVDVTEGEEVRIEASGEYRLMMNDVVGPAGLSIPEDMGGASVGGLTAIVYPPRQGKKRPEPGEPISVGERTQFRPAKSGRLFLRVAVPAKGTAKGEFDVVVSGKIKPGRPL